VYIVISVWSDIGTRQYCSWLRHYATSLEVAGSRPNAVNDFSIYIILLVALCREVYSDSNINEYQKQKGIFLMNRARPLREADNLTAICEPTT
jgi:hypothetical protein